ncbi:Sugar phosphatase YidA [Luteitalea pratensis]|uniref:Sugar phosphatase YidA n=1 Tax=Luteitalea pratensis TaxID=1855912 RepID=A0A143PRG9_LUTPR|nr:HAD hydrolase family protein [Luteitalea pratensis]AMY10763.1 Sugar phosphatase YidA [Luteitalea pratensis]
MKLSAIALDYDGTIASGDVLDPSAQDAIAATRARGIVVVLVTGRILDQLRRVAGDLHFVDGVIAENGAVMHFPDSGRTSALAPPVPEEFVAELSRRGIPFAAGRCLVDADANDAPRLLDIIRTLELPLVLIFNHGRVMVASQGVSKATGLNVVLETLRLSARNTVAIGDAENDHELLRLAEVGVAVAWGRKALQASADIVLDGTGPAAVGDYLRTLAAAGTLPIPPRARRRLLLGTLADGREFSLAVRGRNVLVTGDATSGKSWVAGLLCEQLILHGYSVCVVDPEGDYSSLEGLPGVTVLGRDDAPPTSRELLRALRYPDRSVVLDLSRLPYDDKFHYVRAILPALNVFRRRTGLPHRILLDEAHYYLHDTDAPQLLDFEHNGYTVVTYCASRLPPAVLTSTEVMIVTRESNPAEMDALRARCRGCAAIDASRWAVLGHLKVGQAVALPITEEAAGELRLFTIAPRLTTHVRHREKYVDVPVSSDRAFVFRTDGHAGQRIRTLRQFVSALETTSKPLLAGYIGRGDFSRWIGDVFGDRALAAELQALERRHGAGPREETLREMVSAVRHRYDLADDDVETAESSAH